MDKLFLTILNMSLTGAFVIAAICLARLALKKAPKIISYCLWAVAGFRLVSPFSIESVFSLIPFRAQPIPIDIATQAIPRINSGIPFVDEALNVAFPTAASATSANLLQILTAIGAYVWLLGVAVMLVFGVASYLALKRRMMGAANVEANIYKSDNIDSPFVLGVFRPKIFLPTGLSLQECGYILQHEQTHIRRRDHIIKFAAYFVLCLHWFNPLAWAAFLLMSVDMEMSCDERVLKEMGGDTKKDYSMSLVSLATERRFISGSPIAFGECGVKERVDNVLNFRKPSRVIITLAIVLLTVLTIGFSVNRADGAENADMQLNSGDTVLLSSVNRLIDGLMEYVIYPQGESGDQRELVQAWIEQQRGGEYHLLWVEQREDGAIVGYGLTFDKLQTFRVDYEAYKSWVDAELERVSANVEDMEYTVEVYQRQLDAIRAGEGHAFIIPWGYNSKTEDVGSIIYIMYPPQHWDGEVLVETSGIMTNYDNTGSIITFAFN